MLAISAAELASIRADTAQAVCTETCVISRATPTVGSSGEQIPGTYAVIATTVAGMRSPNATQLAMYADKIGSLKSWQVQLPYGTNVAILDHLLIGGETLLVQADLSPQSLNALTTLLASEVK